MTLQEFIEKYLGKKVDFDGVYGAQCVDLARQYWKEVWEIPQPEGVDGAQEFVTKYEDKPIMQKHIQLFKAGHLVVRGDIVIFGASGANKYGHIAIFNKWLDAHTMEVFEQDGFKQDGAKIAFWKTDRVIGYLRKIET